MNLIGPDQKAAVEKSINGLRSAKNHSDYMGHNKAAVTLVENQHSIAKVRDLPDPGRASERGGRELRA